MGMENVELTPLQYGEMKELFAIFDSNGSQKLEPHEMRYAIRMLGVAITDDEVDELMRDIPADKDGCVTWDHFLMFGAVMLNDASILDHELSMAFNAIELECAFREDDEMLDVELLGNLLSVAGAKPFTKAERCAFVAAVDPNGTGRMLLADLRSMPFWGAELALHGDSSRSASPQTREPRHLESARVRSSHSLFSGERPAAAPVPLEVQVSVGKLFEKKSIRRPPPGPNFLAIPASATSSADNIAADAVSSDVPTTLHSQVAFLPQSWSTSRTMVGTAKGRLADTQRANGQYTKGQYPTPRHTNGNGPYAISRYSNGQCANGQTANGNANGQSMGRKYATKCHSNDYLNGSSTRILWYEQSCRTTTALSPGGVLGSFVNPCARPTTGSQIPSDDTATTFTGRNMQLERF